MPPRSPPRDNKDDARSFSHPSSPHAPSFRASDYAYAPSSQYTHSSHQNASMLDLDDDPRASLASSYSSYAQLDPNSLHPDPQADDVRISLLGPKMRFHSPAPWELDDDSLDQQTHSSRAFFNTSMFSKHKEHQRGKPSISTSSDNPRRSTVTRPSVDSTFSQINPKRSFETTSSKFSYPRGALYTLAQESLSATSLARYPRHEPNFTSSETPNPSTTSSPLRSSPDSPVDFRFPQSSFLPHATTQHPVSPLESHPSFDDTSRRSSLSSEDDIHPYANPDLVISYAVDPPPRSSLRSPITYPGISRNNSTATVTESTTNSSVSRSAVHSTLTPDTSVASFSSKQQRGSSVQKKGISSPMPVHTGTVICDAPVHPSDAIVSPIPPNVSNLPGWTQKDTGPGFSLISLEEARAQHSRIPAIQSVAPRASISTIASGSTMPFPIQGNDTRGTTSSDIPPSMTFNSRSRARSISAGKAKKLQSIVGAAPKLDRRDSEPAVVVQQGSGKSLKHKKSGFMRLLGRNYDKEEPPSPPPVPSLPESCSTQESARPPPKRVPVPSLSSAESEKGPSRFISSPKRAPPLSITTQTQIPISRMSTSTFNPFETIPLEAPGRPWQNDAQPQSAPPNISEFPALKLRPVSTLFSAQFGDIVSSDTVSPSETELDTPRSPSPNAILSPLSSYSQQTNEQPSPSSEDPMLIIKALREEMASAKKAWQMQKWEYEGQIKELKSEILDLQREKDGPRCEACGRGQKAYDTVAQGTAGSPHSKATSVVNRPRVRTGTSARFTDVVI